MLKAFQNRMPHLRMAGLALLAVPGIAFAQVSYVRELAPAPDWPVLSLAQAPVNTSDPLYDPDLANTQWISTVGHFYSFDVRTGVTSSGPGIDFGLSIGADSAAALSNVGTATPLLRILNSRSFLYSFDPATGLQVRPAVRLPIGSASSLVEQGSHLNVIADGYGYSVDPDTGALIEIFQTAGGMALGEFSLETHFQAYGANGLLYVLDYGNGRMQMLDPEDSFAAVGQFDLHEEVTTANFQFAIGSTGNIYLGDGAGGGSFYTEDGTYGGLFTLPGSVVGTPPPEGSSSYLSTDQNGGVYVFDSTGFHQYHDASVVPEPSTVGLLLGAGLLLAAHRRRMRR